MVVFTQIHFKVLCNLFNMAALWEYKLQWIPLGLWDTVMVPWLWETLDHDENMTKLLDEQGPLDRANCPPPKAATPLPLSHPGECCPVSLRQKPAGKTGPHSERGRTRKPAAANPEEGLLGGAQATVDRELSGT